MEERCWNCKKFEEHFYWEHLEETGFHFLKVLEGDFFHGMEFPKKFSRNFRVELPDLITLKVPKSKLWKLSLFKEEERFYFKDGWKEFIDYYSINEGYSLLFKYAGKASFTVVIFDQSGSLRDNSTISKSAKNRVNEKVLNLKRTRSSMIKTSMTSRPACEHQLVNDISDTKSSNGSSDKVIHCKKKLSGVGKYVKLTKNKCKGFIQKRFHGNSSLVRKGKLESSEDIAKILQHFYPNKQCNSSFVKVMLKSHLSEHPFMVIPSRFVNEQFHTKPETILWKQNGKQWVVRCTYRCASLGFSGESLFHFVQDNYLEEGDACVFKLISTSTEVVMDVIIVRAAEIYSILNTKKVRKKI